MSPTGRWRFRWTELGEDQAAGRACVVCQRGLDLDPAPTISVGVSEYDQPVRACLEGCATGAAAIILIARGCFPRR